MNTHKYRFLVVAMLCLMLTGMATAPGSADASAKPNPVVIMETSVGRLIIMLFPDQAPITVKNFLRYVDNGYYDGTVFHRVVKMEIDENKDKRKQQAINIVQGGAYTYPYHMKKPLWSPIPNEDFNDLDNIKGTIAMARLTDPDSATTQFFFNMEDNPGLDAMIISRKLTALEAANMGSTHDMNSEQATKSVSRHGYCVFGKVIRGWDVVEKIHAVKTTRMGRLEDVPEKPVYLKRAYRAQ